MIKWVLTIFGVLGIFGSGFLILGGEINIGISGLIGSFIILAIVKVIELLEEIRYAVSKNSSDHKPLSERTAHKPFSQR